MMNFFLFVKNRLIGLSMYEKPRLSISPILAKKTILTGMPMSDTMMVKILPASDVGVNLP